MSRIAHARGIGFAHEPIEREPCEGPSLDAASPKQYHTKRQFARWMFCWVYRLVCVRRYASCSVFRERCSIRWGGRTSHPGGGHGERDS
eukprot:5995147-Prymnesium_polylepis.1